MRHGRVALARHAADLAVGEQYSRDFTAKLRLVKIDVAASGEEDEQQQLDDRFHTGRLIACASHPITYKTYNDGYSDASEKARAHLAIGLSPDR
jgi:hypothetical protein